MMRRGVLILSAVALCGALSSAARNENAMKVRRARLANVPASAAARANPYEGNADAAKAGRKLYARHCAECHGENLEGRGAAPALNTRRVEQSAPGDIFWVLTNGDLRGGMPAWSDLPEERRWQIVTYLKSARNQ